MKTIFEILVPTNTQHCKSNIIGLFENERLIKCHEAETEISYSSPTPLVSLDRRWFSKNNWTGFNPFVWVSGIDVKFDETRNVATIVIHRARTILYLLGGILMDLIVVFNAPAILSLFVSVVLAIILSQIWFGSKTLIKNEIIDSLRK